MMLTYSKEDICTPEEYSEQNSCMNNYIPYFNTISREAIVKRIMEYAGESYSFEEFVKNDKVEQPKYSL